MSTAIRPRFFNRRIAICLCWVLCWGIPVAVFGQTNYYAPNGTEYAIIGSLPGDQVFPDAALNSSGGFVVWQDNITDGSGWGVSAARLDSTLSLTTWQQQVNVQGTNDQQNPRVALLKNGGAAFVWQGGKPGCQHIYARFLTPTNTWLSTDDVPVSPQSITNVSYITNIITTITTNYSHGKISGYTTNTTTTITTNTSASAVHFQINPAVAVLNNGNAVVVWSSFDEVSSSSLQDVYGQVFSPVGQKIGGEFLVNQFTDYNQRTPTVAALADGGFVVGWISEQERTAFNLSVIDNTNGTPPTVIGTPSIDVYARLYDSNGVARTSEFLVNTGPNPAADPAVAAARDGGFMVTWCARDLADSTNDWDIYARSFSNAVGGAVVCVNAHLYGDQYAPRISAIGGDFLIVWTSLGQDGSREGVFGRFVHEDGSPVNGEFQVNTSWQGQQMQPTVASDGDSQFLAVWTGFTFTAGGMDLFAQRYINVGTILQPINSVYVHAPFTLSNDVYQPQLQVSWPELQGISVSNYRVYVDGASSPTALTASNAWTMTAAYGLTINSTHSFQVDYVVTDGRKADKSPSVSGTTWGGCNWHGIPCEWMQQYFGNNAGVWPLATDDSDGDGMSNYQEFLAGTVPTNATSVLRVQISNSQQRAYLSWNTQPGFTYQVQVSTNLTTWSNLPPPNDAPRFAAGTTDSIYVGGGSAGYYRILLLR